MKSWINFLSPSEARSVCNSSSKYLASISYTLFALYYFGLPNIIHLSRSQWISSILDWTAWRKDTLWIHPSKFKVSPVIQYNCNLECFMEVTLIIPPSYPSPCMDPPLLIKTDFLYPSKREGGGWILLDVSVGMESLISSQLFLKL